MLMSQSLQRKNLRSSLISVAAAIFGRDVRPIAIVELALFGVFLDLDFVSTHRS